MAREKDEVVETERNFVIAGGTQITYKQFRAIGKPRKTLGSVGDIYINDNIAEKELYGKTYQGWKKWEGPKFRNDKLVSHHTYSTYCLWSRFNSIGWISKSVFQAKRSMETASVCIKKALDAQVKKSKHKPSPSIQSMLHVESQYLSKGTESFSQNAHASMSGVNAPKPSSSSETVSIPQRSPSPSHNITMELLQTSSPRKDSPLKSSTSIPSKPTPVKSKSSSSSASSTSTPVVPSISQSRAEPIVLEIVSDSEDDDIVEVSGPFSHKSVNLRLSISHAKTELQEPIVISDSEDDTSDAPVVVLNPPVELNDISDADIQDDFVKSFTQANAELIPPTSSGVNQMSPKPRVLEELEDELIQDLDNCIEPSSINPPEVVCSSPLRAQGVIVSEPAIPPDMFSMTGSLSHAQRSPVVPTSTAALCSPASFIHVDLLDDEAVISPVMTRKRRAMIIESDDDLPSINGEPATDRGPSNAKSEEFVSVWKSRYNTRRVENDEEDEDEDDVLPAPSAFSNRDNIVIGKTPAPTQEAQADDIGEGVQDDEELSNIDITVSVYPPPISSEHLITSFRSVLRQSFTSSPFEPISPPSSPIRSEPQPSTSHLVPSSLPSLIPRTINQIPFVKFYEEAIKHQTSSKRSTPIVSRIPATAPTKKRKAFIPPDVPFSAPPAKRPRTLRPYSLQNLQFQSAAPAPTSTPTQKRYTTFRPRSLQKLPPDLLREKQIYGTKATGQGAEEPDEPHAGVSNPDAIPPQIPSPTHVVTVKEDLTTAPARKFTTARLLSKQRRPSTSDSSLVMDEPPLKKVKEDNGAEVDVSVRTSAHSAKTSVSDIDYSVGLEKHPPKVSKDVSALPTATAFNKPSGSSPLLFKRADDTFNPWPYVYNGCSIVFHNGVPIPRSAKNDPEISPSTKETFSRTMPLGGSPAVSGKVFSSFEEADTGIEHMSSISCPGSPQLESTNIKIESLSSIKRKDIEKHRNSLSGARSPAALCDRTFASSLGSADVIVCSPQTQVAQAVEHIHIPSPLLPDDSSETVVARLRKENTIFKHILELHGLQDEVFSAFEDAGLIPSSVDSARRVIVEAPIASLTRFLTRGHEARASSSHPQANIGPLTPSSSSRQDFDLPQSSVIPPGYYPWLYSNERLGICYQAKRNNIYCLLCARSSKPRASPLPMESNKDESFYDNHCKVHHPEDVMKIAAMPDVDVRKIFKSLSR